jgi:hypothetical protein
MVCLCWTYHAVFHYVVVRYHWYLVGLFARHVCSLEAACSDRKHPMYIVNTWSILHSGIPKMAGMLYT